MACDGPAGPVAPAPRPGGGRGQGDHGVVVVLVAASLGAMLMMVAMVLDHSGARRDREADQVAADAMALAASGSLGGSDRRADVACLKALEYLQVNLPAPTTLSRSYAPDCATVFGGACQPATARTLTIPAGQFTVTFTHPLPDPPATGTQPLDPLYEGRAPTSRDGSPCQRFGVRVQQTRANQWAAGSVTLDVKAVGRYLPGLGNAHAPLVLLAPTQCEVLEVGGSSRLSVGSATPGVPGNIAIDSDGSQCGNKVVFNVFGNDPNGKVVADKVWMWAITAGNGASAARPELISPTPVGSQAPVGRFAMDWRYNCDPAKGCPGSGPPYIDQMRAAWGGPARGADPVPQTLSWSSSFAEPFTTWAPTRSCSGTTGNIVVPKGNWYINCGTTGLSSGGRITFKGGHVVSDGPIKAGGGIRANCAGGQPTTADDPLDCGNVTEPMVLYYRSGDLIGTGSSWGPLNLRQTFVLLDAGAFDKSGNQDVVWTAPADPTHPFDDLLLWTETTSDVRINGTVGMQLEGTLFLPNARVVLSGNMNGEALGAQIFAHRATVAGNAGLDLRPKVDRMTSVGRGRVALIR